MPSYWISFIDKYEKQIPQNSLERTLKAFWYYAEGQEDVSNTIMGYEEPKPVGEQ